MARTRVLILLGSVAAAWLPGWLSAAPEPGLKWEPVPGGRVASVSTPPGQPGFTWMSPALTGLHFTNTLAQSRHLVNQLLLNGSGVACGDVDGDGWCDLYFCGLDGPNALYRNLGQWKFQDITTEAGVACPGVDATGAAFADLEGDGDLDLIVNSFGGGTFIFLNDGRGRFQLLGTSNVGKGGSSMALGDLNGDGYLDLYVANYRTTALMDMPNTRFWMKEVNGRRVVTTVNGRSATEPDLTNRFVVNAAGSIEERGEVDVLYLSVRGTNFAGVSFTGGLFLDEDGQPLASPPFDWGLSVMIRDFNADGWPDIYVCNDFDTPDRFWLSLKGRAFQAAPRLALRKTALFSMAMDAADINRDGFDDLFLLDMLSRDHVHRLTQMGDRKPPVPVVGQMDNRPEYMMNMLLLNRGDGTYAEIGQLGGLQASEWSWACVFLDVDLDGWEDLLISNGNERDARHLDIVERLRAQRIQQGLSSTEILQARTAFPRYATLNLAFRNRRDLTFEEVGQQWGFDRPTVSNGTALADLDNDGDLDLVVNDLNGPAGLYRNNTSAPRLAVRLRGRPPNTAGIGARVIVRGGPVAQSQEFVCGGRYVSCDQAVRVFAAGGLTNELSVEVTWRSGRRSVVTGLRLNQYVEIDEAQANSPVAPATPPARRPAFEDVSSRLAHVHHEEAYDDHERQPLLSRKLSQLGPGVTWCDLDQDGWEDLMIGSGKGGQLSVFRNDGRGGFKPWQEAPFTQPVTRDQTTVLPWPRGPGDIVILAGSANYEDGLAAGGCARLYDLRERRLEDTLPAQAASTGPMALADVDGDGDLDLFVGGRVRPGQYPRPASSFLFRAEGTRLETDAANSKRFDEVGMVSGAVFTDLDGDGDPDLVLACEWGPLRVFRNDRGQFESWEWRLSLRNEGLTPPTSRPPGSSPTTLSQLIGWWNSVNAGDFDGDGRLDLVGANWGRNTPYEWHRGQPLRLVHGDLDGNGTEDLIEAYYEPVLRKIVPERMLSFVSKGLPLLRQRFPTYEAFAKASVEDICGDAFTNMVVLQANWLESTLFLNRGDHFEARPLPVEAQLAPAFAVCVGDLDGDGAEDLFLSQNFFAVHPETPRYDGGRGLWLRGDGRGGFQAVSGQDSGVKVYGEQRGAVLCDFDHDGRVDLAVSQNGAQTKLYRNMSAKPGLRVRLAGAPGNPLAAGAALRVMSARGAGPLREIHAGSGYWSHDAATQVFARPEGPARLSVRWPGGRPTTSDLPAGAAEVVIDPTGTLRTQK